MSQTAAAARPWWAEVEHLRPREDAELPRAVGDVERPRLGDVERPRLGDVERPRLGDAELPRAVGDDEVPRAPARRPFPRAEAAATRGRTAAEHAARAAEHRHAAAHAGRPRSEADVILLDDQRRRERREGGRRTIEIRGQIAAPPPRRLVEIDRRRPGPRPVERLADRPDRIALWAVILGVVLIIVAAMSGTKAEAATKRFGERPLKSGTRGPDVRTLQHLLRVPADGVFGPQTGRAVRRFQRRSRLGVDGVVGPATRAALVRRRMKVRTASWFGPGLYGNRTACGQRLTRRLRGVAHKRLACGTTVVLHHRGRFTTARVVDRGPFTTGVALDLTAPVARSLGLSATSRVSAAY